jgi:hypothetical protein
MPRSLADGHTKFTILTTSPANPAAPTAAELNGGIDASDRILSSDFTFGPTDSDKVNEKSLAATGNANAIAASNYAAGFSPFRYFNASTGAVDPTGDVVFTACKTKGTELWCYARRTGKLASAAWASGDEIFFGADLITDNPQPPSDLGGYIKTHIATEVQTGYSYVAVA